MTAGSAAPSWLAAVAADLLAQGERLDRLSRLLSCAAFAGLIGCVLVRGTGPILPLGLVLSLGCGMAQAWFAVRVGLDAALFARLASPAPVAPDRAGSDAPAPDLAALDRAMLELGMIEANRIGRPLLPRIAGARRLLARQALALAVQIAVAPAAALLALWLA